MPPKDDAARTRWRYDEFKPVGRDYGSQAEVDVYDSSHADFRDLVAESNQVLDTLNLAPGSALIDFGCGTGTFAIEAARRRLQVFAVDVSPAMLAKARAKAEREGVAGIEFRHAGFLSFEAADESADAVTSTFSFHHLPDFWKGVALERLHRLLRPGGQFYLHDVIIETHNALQNIDAFIARQERAGGDFLRDDAEGHFRDEFSTYDWMMDGLLSRAGLRIEEKRIEGGVLGTYRCRRPALARQWAAALRDPLG